MESIADRRLVDKLLNEYIERGYLEEVFVAENVYINPLLPIRKPNGSYRFTNYFRKLNYYFPSTGTAQVDVWRKLWELKPKWKFFMEIDLKDGFFGIPVDEELSRLFGFTYGVRRFRWVRLPQGWKWSLILFCEKIVEILKGLDCPQYSDNVLVGSDTEEGLLEKALEVFHRFDQYGIKVNFDKVKWLITSISFLGYEIKDGKMSLKNYLKEKKKSLRWVSDIKGQERAIGILSYARKVVKKIEEILAPLREDLAVLKKETPDHDWFVGLNDRIQNALARAIDYTEWLTLPGCTADSFVLETDWSGNYSGYLLFARQNSLEKSLVDQGSKVAIKAASSYLGELDTIVWACKKIKAYRGSLPLLIRLDSHSVVDKSRAYEVYDQDIRSYRRWSWLIENEPGFEIEFFPGFENNGADLLSQPVKLCEKKGALVTMTQEQPEVVKMILDMTTTI